MERHSHKDEGAEPRGVGEGHGGGAKKGEKPIKIHSRAMEEERQWRHLWTMW